MKKMGLTSRRKRLLDHTIPHLHELRIDIEYLDCHGPRRHHFLRGYCLIFISAEVTGKIEVPEYAL